MDNRVILLITLCICMALAQNNMMSQRCSCRRVRERFGPPKQIMDIQILPPTHSCDRLEIVVSLKNGLQYCLNPKAENVQNIIRSIVEMKKKMTTAPKPTSSSASDE
ncbi:alveolar macrophage chemotactic factor-like [Sardina pilchardus]|uniref:alveolar macrophage chemotactic factor-like n=1 Tax=Sardina pilchardus TaxID=27697 RepID=UPI002E14DCB0